MDITSLTKIETRSRYSRNRLYYKTAIEHVDDIACFAAVMHLPMQG